MKIKEDILNNEQYILDNLSCNDCFFWNIPYNYGYLISYYKDNNPFILEDLYDKYFDTLEKDDKFILEHIHLRLVKDDNNPYDINTDCKFKEFSYFLKEIKKNSKYITMLKNLYKKTNIEYKYIMSFISKYSETYFFNILYNKPNYSKKDIKKIDYLSKAEKIEDIDSINNLDDFSLNDLINLKKNKSVMPKISGGPDTLGTYSKYFSKESSNREIIRINKNGSFKIVKIDEDNHLDGVIKIYNDLNFKKDSTAIENALNAAKIIESTTFIIEENECFIIVPIPISKKELKKCLKLIKNSYNDAKFGLITYNINNDNIEILNNDFINKEQLVDQILNLENIKTIKKKILKKF